MWRISTVRMKLSSGANPASAGGEEEFSKSIAGGTLSLILLFLLPCLWHSPFPSLLCFPNSSVFLGFRAFNPGKILQPLRFCSFSRNPGWQRMKLRGWQLWWKRRRSVTWSSQRN
ncbi:hypothetical protein P7K49_039542 [Saguinus oedipus]|uniref:Uncharacterized protein n=1 Tax=Saguinus oedipus TaxID=9490 RepID=A0ABQ9TAJ8_SAGOE|nr:hypothetical protein P7K49_039542 [Saguinus oedipus]